MLKPMLAVIDTPTQFGERFFSNMCCVAGLVSVGYFWVRWTQNSAIGNFQTDKHKSVSASFFAHMQIQIMHLFQLQHLTYLYWVDNEIHFVINTCVKRLDEFKSKLRSKQPFRPLPARHPLSHQEWNKKEELKGICGDHERRSRNHDSSSSTPVWSIS